MRTIGVGFKWLLLISGAVTACAPARIDLDQAVRQRLPSASAVHVVVYPADLPPLLTAKAIGTGSLFGAIGGAVVAARAASIGKELMANGSLPTLTRSTELPAGQELDDLKKTSLRPFVLDVRSNGSIMYYGSNWARYRLLYHARVRLVDTEQPRILWQGICQLQGAEDPAQAPTLDELEAPDGVAYRRLITDATSACAADLLRQFHGQTASGG